MILLRYSSISRMTRTTGSREPTPIQTVMRVWTSGIYCDKEKNNKSIHPALKGIERRLAKIKTQPNT
jgi:hypothetical protein